MKLTVFFLSVSMICFSCKEKTAETNDTPKNDSVIAGTIYPENLSKVFDAHGGLAMWKQMQTLKFTRAEEEGDEIITVDLKSRKSKIDMPYHILGNNGKDVWLLNKDTTSYKGDPRFYNNLMFYFFAMPFVMADKGIKYGEAQPLTLDGITYSGIKISFDNNIGESPNDEYLLYYDKDFKLIWLSYTVTYFTKQKSTEFYFMKYKNWKNVNGLYLPETLEWYKPENNLPAILGKEFKFVDIDISKQKMAPELFEKPDSAELVK